MCRSAAQGGRRCSGRDKSSAGAGGTSPAVAEQTITDSPAVPTREQADQLAAKLPADRKGWDGKPLDAAGRRLYALRDSGYQGPIDQDGYPDTTSEGAGILRRMATDRGETVTW